MAPDRPLTMREGVVAVLVRGSRVLLIRRGMTVPFAGYWAPPSGKLEPGETVAAALVREVEEELGWIAEPVRPLWESVSQDGGFRLFWWEAEVVGGSLRPSPREVAEVRWIEPGEFAQLEPTFDSDLRFFREILPELSTGRSQARTRAVLFDFDYTLADSSAGVIECANHALRRLGIAAAAPEQIRPTIGLSLAETFRRLTARDDADAAAAFAGAFVERADEVMAALTTPYPHVAPLLRRLTDLGLPLAIVSTKFRYRIEEILGMHGLDSAFSLIVGGEDVTHTKPQPDALWLACRRLGVLPSHALYVGDHVVDAVAADAAGIPMVAVLTGTCIAGDFAPAPLAIIPTLAEFEVPIGPRREPATGVD